MIAVFRTLDISFIKVSFPICLLPLLISPFCTTYYPVSPKVSLTSIFSYPLGISKGMAEMMYLMMNQN
jgi:hypothetical protein